jgi:MOSC domain-containing protein YiiM
VSTNLGAIQLSLPAGTLLHVGSETQVEVTGLRNPCKQIEAFKTGPLAAVLEQKADGTLIRKAGIMGVVRRGGVVCAGDLIEVEYPILPWRGLERV